MKDQSLVTTSCTTHRAGHNCSVLTNHKTSVLPGRKVQKKTTPWPPLERTEGGVATFAGQSCAHDISLKPSCIVGHTAACLSAVH